MKLKLLPFLLLLVIAGCSEVPEPTYEYHEQAFIYNLGPSSDEFRDLTIVQKCNASFEAC